MAKYDVVLGKNIFRKMVKDNKFNGKRVRGKW